jgi:radical SAM superfamily enzyme YgiQ (UPF0313 family)
MSINWKSWCPFFKKGAGSTNTKKTFRLVLTFISPEGSAMSMPLACLSAYVKKHIPGIEVSLVGINLQTPNDPVYTVEGYMDRVNAKQPDLVAISCMSPHWHLLDPYLLALKRIHPAVPVLLGGYQAILVPEESIAHPGVDLICVGDGEVPLTMLIRRMLGQEQGKVPGLWEKMPTGEILKSPPLLTENLSSMPFPDYTIFERNGSLQGIGFSILGPKNLFILPVMTGRGCPYRCSYCCNTRLLEMYRDKGAYLRKYDPEALVEELCRLRDRYGVGYFEFWDELFLSNMKFAYHFLDLYKERIHLPFSINSRVEKMDEHFCRTASEAGCHTIWFGIESGSESYRLNFLGRKMTNSQIIAAAETAKKYGIRRLTFNIVGMPFQTRQDMLETLELNRTIRPEYFFFFTYIPLKGTPLYTVAEQNNLLLEETAKDYQEGLKTGKFSMNIKEHEGGITAEEFREVCQQMLVFQTENNRLNLDDAAEPMPRADLTSAPAMQIPEKGALT